MTNNVKSQYPLHATSVGDEKVEACKCKKFTKRRSQERFKTKLGRAPDKFALLKLLKAIQLHYILLAIYSKTLLKEHGDRQNL